MRRPFRLTRRSVQRRILFDFSNLAIDSQIIWDGTGLEPALTIEHQGVVLEYLGVDEIMPLAKALLECARYCRRFGPPVTVDEWMRKQLDLSP